MAPSTKKLRVFNPATALAEAKVGRLTGAALKKAIATAQEFGNTQAAEQLKLYVVQPTSFAGDAAPMDIRERAAQGISALMAMGHSLNRTKQMLKKHGLIETMNRIAKYPDSTKNFDRLCAAGLEHLTAEAIVLDFPNLFEPRAVEVARKRLNR